MSVRGFLGAAVAFSPHLNSHITTRIQMLNKAHGPSKHLEKLRLLTKARHVAGGKCAVGIRLLPISQCHMVFTSNF